jgi:hypothetical protein
MLFELLADNTNPGSIAYRLRRKRFQTLLTMVQSAAGVVSILDVGGRQAYWDLMLQGTEFARQIHVTLLNLEPITVTSPTFTAFRGDGRSMPQFSDRQFDIVFSNSTIEHLGRYDDQARMAQEIRRVGRHYYVQTPNRRFPIEPHFLFPYFQFLPVATRIWLVRHFALGWYARIPDHDAAAREVTTIRLLTRPELAALFPDATIHEERFAGLVKSLVAVS